MRPSRTFATLLPALVLAAPVLAREVTFQDRVAAQEAIERVYYSHQLGATKPFEEAFPRTAIEAKVRTYLKQSVALERFWNTPVTAPMLRAEIERIARETQLPQRLEEIYRALGHDPVLVEECFARATLVDRLIRSFYAFDAARHTASQAEAEQLRDRLIGGDLDLWTAHPERSEMTIRRAVEGDEQPAGVDSPPGDTLDLSPEKFERLRASAPASVGEVGAIAERSNAFTITALLAESSDSAQIVTYTVEKRGWRAWWSEVESGLDPSNLTAASEGGELPLPAGDGTGLERNMAPAGTPCVLDDAWDNGSLDDVPTARSRHTAVWTGTLMIVWGGDDATLTNTGGRYDPLTDTWTPTSTAGAPTGRYDHTVVWTGGQMIVWGGQLEHAYADTGGRYDPVTDTWTPTSTTGAPTGRRDHTAAWTGSLMVVWGGNFANTGGRYDPVTDTWTPTSTAGAPAGRQDPTAVWTGSQMIVWGGFRNAYDNTGGRYDPVTDTWTPTSTASAPTGRVDHTAVWTGNRMIVWGGNEGGPYQDPPPTDTGGRYDPVTDTWTPTSTAGAPTPRDRHTAIWTGSRMIVWGGVAYNLTNTGGRYDPVTDTWMPTSTAGAPTSRVNATAVWTGSQLIVWGGYDGTSANTGGRYDAATDAWTPTSTAGAPGSRRFHTAVWTGSLMILWGGGGGPLLDAGGRYDPLTDTWTPTSTSGAPARRERHTAVWTGSHMIVWGGYVGGFPGNSNTGGRYDPVTDTWTPTATAGAPIGRFSHTAVWTGSQMIVWGGPFANSNQSQNTGGRYDPVSDTWMPTSTAGAPTGRYRNTAVWTGSRMIVWGGNNASSVFNTGGRYDPVTDAWTPTSTAGAPSGRTWHTAVWTGSQMIVWGGDDQRSSRQDTGGRYDPATDTWTPTSTAGAPTARYLHTVVWTGSQMVVWGGEQGTFLGSSNTGGRYDPATDTWTPTSTAGAPTARTQHTAVWTGSQMIVWGGTVSGGGRYLFADDTDRDSDGFPICAGDCDDSNASMFPGAPEVCDDDLDNDCDGLTDEDFAPPVLTCPAGSTVECSSPSGALVSFPPATVHDSCDDSPVVMNSHSSGGADVSGVYPLGKTVVTITARDASGNESSCVVPVIVRDTMPPAIALTAEPNLLWPPNHEMARIALSAITVDVCDPAASAQLVSVESSEPDDATGEADGHTTDDIQNADVGANDPEVFLRAERTGAGGGRFYAIRFAATDASGNAGAAMQTVVVPHDQAGESEPVTLDIVPTSQPAPDADALERQPGA